jgi:UDP:flavonoid glycosyltransferase YjiC (YdhE family)
MADLVLMRIVLASEGTRGDLYPMLVLGEALRRQGHDPVVCAPPNFDAVVRARGMAFLPVGCDVRDYLRTEARAITGSTLRFLSVARRYSLESVRAQFAALPAAADGADLIVGAGVQLAAASVAELHGIPYRYAIYCPALLPSREHAPAILPIQPIPAWARRFAWWFARGPLTATVGLLVNRERRALGMSRISDTYRHLVGERALLAADREIAPVPIDSPYIVEQTSALQPDGGAPLPEKLGSFLDAGPPPVFFGFGSMPDPDPSATTRLLLQVIESVGCRALLSSGWAEIGEGALPEGVMQVGDVDHARLFPRVAAVVHHGGAGTVTTAARAGAPQVVVPHVLDQFYWADRVRMLGIGVVAPRRSKLEAATLDAALREVLDNEALAERSADVAARIRERVRTEAHPAERLLEI